MPLSSTFFINALKLIASQLEKILNHTRKKRYKKLNVLKNIQLNILKILSPTTGLAERNDSKTIIKNHYDNVGYDWRKFFETREINEIMTILASARIYYWLKIYNEYSAHDLHQEMARLDTENELETLRRERSLNIENCVYRHNSNERALSLLLDRYRERNILNPQDLTEIIDTVRADMIPLEVMIFNLSNEIG